MRKVLLIIVLVLSVFQFVKAEVVVYPQPQGVEGSTVFSVSIKQNGVSSESFSYLMRSTIPTHLELSNSFTNFSFSGEVTISIQWNGEETLKSVVVRPLNMKILPTITGNNISFNLNQPALLSIEVNGSTKHPLLLFANPLEENKPLATDSSVVYFKPGVYSVGDFEMPAGKTSVYVEGGAYIKGRFDADSTIKISGRGIISGEDYTYKTNVFRSLVYAESAEGITIINTPHYNLHATTAKWVKCISWYGQTDGVHINENGDIKNCFFKVNDDALKLYNSNIRVNNCVIWLLYTGAPFQLTWNLMGETRKNIEVNNIDIIHTDWETEHINRAIFNSVHGGDANIDGVRFNNIRVEGDVWRIMMLTLKRTRYGSAKVLGNIRNIEINNMTVQGKVLHSNVLNGIVENGKISRIENITFKNLYVDGEEVKNSNEAGGWKIDPKTTQLPKFK